MATALPFLSSFLYVLAALFLKEASGRGVSVGMTATATNVVCGVAFAGLWLLGGTLPEPTAWVQPALVGLIFLGGQVAGFVALQQGAVSVATPVMGVKIILVALFVTLLVGEPVRPALWAAAVLSSAGVAFLSRGGKGAAAGGTAPAVVFGLLTAAAFALFDVLVQKWSPAWGAGRFLPVMMGFVALYTVVLAAAFPRLLGRVPAGALRPLALGALLMASQAVILIAAIALYRKATEANVMYSARGLWSVAAVWIVGHWWGNRERESGAGVFRARLLGAVLVMSAIALAVAG